MKGKNMSGWFGMDLLIGLEVSPSLDGFRLLLVQQKKKRRVILNRMRFSHTQGLLQWLEKTGNIPIVIYYPIEERLEGTVGREEQDVVTSLLGVSIEKRSDVIVQSILTTDGKKWATLVRKERVLQLMALIQPFKERVLSINLCPGAVSFLVPNLPLYSPLKRYEVNIGGQVYRWQNGPIDNSQNEAIQVRLQELSHILNCEIEELGNYASLGLFWMIKGLDMPQLPDLAVNRKGVQFRQRLLRGGAYGLGVAISILVIAFFAKTFYLQQTNTLQSRLVTEAPVLQELQQAEGLLSQKQAFFHQVKRETLASSTVAFIVDRIFTQVPKGIVLDHVIYKPGPAEVKKHLSMDAKLRPSWIIIGTASDTQQIAQFTQGIGNLRQIGHSEIFYSEFDYQAQRHNFALILEEHASNMSPDPPGPG